jgi:hypothetical protein
MTTYAHTPGPWANDRPFIVASDPDGAHPDIYIAEIVESDDEGRLASPVQREANGHLIAAAPTMFDALLDVKRLAAKSGDPGSDPFALLELIAYRAQDALAL